MEKTVHLKITGRVQGVWYRAWTRETANRLNLNGWVRNRKDGTVEALVRGEEASVDELIRLCWDGPPAAKVKHIEMTLSDENTGQGFFQQETV